MPPGLLLASQLAVISALLVSFWQLVRLIQARMLHTTVRRAIERDPASAIGLLERMEARPAQGDDRNALVLIALGLALAGLGLILGGGSVRPLLGASLFPMLVGAALLLRTRLARRASE